MILDRPHLINNTPTISLTYIEVLVLERDDLINIAQRHPVVSKRMKRASLRITMARMLVKHLRKMKAKSGKRLSGKFKLGEDEWWKQHQMANLQLGTGNPIRDAVRAELEAFTKAIKEAVPADLVQEIRSLRTAFDELQQQIAQQQPKPPLNGQNRGTPNSATPSRKSFTDTFKDLWA